MAEKDQRRDPIKGATIKPEPKPSAFKVWYEGFRLPAYTWPAIGFLAVILAGSYGVKEAMGRWKIGEIELVGRLNVVDANRLAQTLVWVKDEGFFELDVQQVYDDLMGIPMLEQVSVKKRWPDTLEVHVREGVPVAVWNEQQILSASGRLFPLTEQINTGGLMRLNGDESAGDIAVRLYRRVQQSLDSLGLGIVSMSVTTLGAVEVELSNGWIVKLGRKEIDTRLDRLVVLLNTLEQPAVNQVDFRYGNAAAVTWHTMGETG